MKKRKEFLKESTYSQSHVFRAPLSRLMAIANLLKEHEVIEVEKSFFIDSSILSSKELDVIIQEIVKKSESINSK